MQVLNIISVIFQVIASQSMLPKPWMIEQRLFSVSWFLSNKLFKVIYQSVWQVSYKFPWKSLKKIVISDHECKIYLHIKQKTNSKVTFNFILLFVTTVCFSYSKTAYLEE